jgi:hypothetical protein
MMLLLCLVYAVLVPLLGFLGYAMVTSMNERNFLTDRERLTGQDLLAAGWQHQYPRGHWQSPCGRYLLREDDVHPGWLLSLRDDEHPHRDSGLCYVMCRGDFRMLCRVFNFNPAEV